MERFVLGFVIGATVSGAVVLATTPKSGAAVRRRITEVVQAALEAGRVAAAAREQELWAEFHRRLQEGKPKEEQRRDGMAR